MTNTANTKKIKYKWTQQVWSALRHNPTLCAAKTKQPSSTTLSTRVWCSCIFVFYWGYLHSESIIFVKRYVRVCVPTYINIYIHIYTYKFPAPDSTVNGNKSTWQAANIKRAKRNFSSHTYPYFFCQDLVLPSLFPIKKKKKSVNVSFLPVLRHVEIGKLTKTMPVWTKL